MDRLLPVVLRSPKRAWTAENVLDWIATCEIQGGIPVFRTRYAGVRFDRQVEGRCYGGTGPEITTVFTGVPPEIIERMEETTGDWRWLKAELAKQLISERGSEPAGPEAEPRL